MTCVKLHVHDRHNLRSNNYQKISCSDQRRCSINWSCALLICICKKLYGFQSSLMLDIDQLACTLRSRIYLCIAGQQSLSMLDISSHYTHTAVWKHLTNYTQKFCPLSHFATHTAPSTPSPRTDRSISRSHHHHHHHIHFRALFSSTEGWAFWQVFLEGVLSTQNYFEGQQNPYLTSFCHSQALHPMIFLACQIFSVQPHSACILLQSSLCCALHVQTISSYWCGAPHLSPGCQALWEGSLS